MFLIVAEEMISTRLIHSFLRTRTEFKKSYSELLLDIKENPTVVCRSIREAVKFISEAFSSPTKVFLIFGDDLLHITDLRSRVVTRCGVVMDDFSRIKGHDEDKTLLRSFFPPFHAIVVHENSFTSAAQH